MKKKLILPFLVLGLALFLSVTLWQKNTMAILCIGMVSIIGAFFLLFEQKKVATEKVVLIALLSSIASIGRIVFSSIPSVQPASFIIMMTGLVFGGETGFLTGCITALASNLVLGQGPWTIWQMFCWGSMGFLSHAFAPFLKKTQIGFALYGLLWGFVYGWIMNAWFVLAGYGDGGINFPGLLAAGIASFPMDLAHGAANTVLIMFFSRSFIKMFGRISIKYGLEGE